MSEILLIIIIVTSLTIILSYFSYRQKQSVWRGQVVKKDKKSVIEEDGLDKEYLTLVFKDENNKTHKIQVDQKTYDKFSVGDKVIKKKGEYLPQKI